MAKIAFKRIIIPMLNRYSFHECNGYRLCTSSAGSNVHESIQNNGKRYEDLFSSAHVQKLLRRMTGYDPEKLFRKKQSSLREPVYKFMTDEELELQLKYARRRGMSRLMCPPYLRRTLEPPAVISKDPELQGLLLNKLVCVDIYPGCRDLNRRIVVREKSGLLREANTAERFRTNQVFFPKFGREITMPPMFEEEHLSDVLKRREYYFILERACIQFEPDDPEYIRVTETTYRHVDKYKQFDVLRSTRHFGAMAFFLVLEKSIDNLLIDMIERLLAQDAANLVELYYLAHNPERWKELHGVMDIIHLLKVYATEESENSGKLELVIESLVEHLQDKMEQR